MRRNIRLAPGRNKTTEDRQLEIAGFDDEHYIKLIQDWVLYKNYLADPFNVMRHTQTNTVYHKEQVETVNAFQCALDDTAELSAILLRKCQRQTCQNVFARERF